MASNYESDRDQLRFDLLSDAPWRNTENRTERQMEPKFSNIVGTRYGLAEYELVNFGP